MEIFYFHYDLTPNLAELARSLGIPEGQPFISDEQGMSLESFCSFVGIKRNDLDEQQDTTRESGWEDSLSCVTDVNDYLLHRTGTSKSTNTWKAEAEQLGIFLRWVKAQGKHWKDITLEDFRAFYRTRRLQPSPHTKRRISGKTWNACIGAVSRFYAWAAVTGRNTQVPFTYRKIRIPEVGQVDKNTITESIPDDPVRFLTLEEYKLFRQALGQVRNGGRDQAFADTLVSTGLRLSEGNSLTISRLPDPDAPRYAGIKAIPFTVIGKGSKKRRIRFPKTTLRGLEIYKGEDRANAITRLRTRRFGSKGGGVLEPQELWLTERGTPMSAPRWEEIFNEASRRCDIHCTPHMLRHTFAIYTLSELLEKTICAINELRLNGRERYSTLIHNPLRQLADLLGHRNVTTTFIYLDLIEQCEAVVDDAIAEWTKEVV
jgi:site-specific recombinase XerD